MADTNYYITHTGAELDEAIRKVLSGELDVPLQEKTATPTTSSQIIVPDSSYKGLSKVTVNPIPQSYTDKVHDDGYDEGYDAGYDVGHTDGHDEGYAKGLEDATPTLQSKTVTPSTSQQTISPDSDYDGLSKVVVNAIPQSYTDGIYDQGYSEGESAGYSTGYDAGYEAAKLYQRELTYIQSSGNQFCMSGIPYSTSNTYVIEAECCFIGTTEGYSGWNAGGLFGSVNGYWHNGASASSMTSTSFTTIKLTINSGSSSNAVTTLTRSGTTTTITRTHPSLASYANITYPIFAYSSNGNGIEGFASMRLKQLKMTVNGTLVRHYIPVLDLDGVACLYDKVKRNLEYNCGKGTFSYA